MPVTVEIVDKCKKKDLEDVFTYFTWVDNKFSTFKKTSEISKINQGTLPTNKYSKEMKEILELCEQTKKETGGYFEIEQNGKIDPSGLVKGWAILNAANILEKKGFINFYVDAGSDIQVSGKNSEGKPWKVGIRHPFSKGQIVKVLSLNNCAIATSGIYERGSHIINPKTKKGVTDIVSLTVIAPNILDADRLATAAFCMGKDAISFVEKHPKLEGYMIDNEGIGTSTSGFAKYVA